jgi:hypothetical protein
MTKLRILNWFIEVGIFRNKNQKKHFPIRELFITFIKKNKIENHFKKNNKRVLGKTCR